MQQNTSAFKLLLATLQPDFGLVKKTTDPENLTKKKIFIIFAVLRRSV